MTRCVGCGAALPRAARGRPRLRCDTCTADHRRAYWREHKRKQRAR